VPDSSEKASTAAPPKASIQRAAGLGVITSVVGLLAAVVRSKASAVFLGPSGVGMAAEVQQIAMLAFVPLGALSGPALLQALAREKNDGAEPRAIISAVTWLATFGLVLSVLTVGAGFELLPNSWSAGTRPLLALACAGSLGTAAASVGIALLTFEGALGTTARLQVATNVVGAVLVAFSTALAGLTGQFFAFALSGAISAFLVYRYARKAALWPASLRPSFDTDFLTQAVIQGGTSLVAAGALQTALLVIRTKLEQVGGAEANGQFQAAWAVGSLYLNMVLSSMGTFVFPRYAAARDTAELQREVTNAAVFIMKLAPPVVILAISFSDIAIQLLYSHRFDGAIGILRWQFVGDVAKALSWVYAGPLLYRSRVRAFLVTEFTAAVVLAVTTWLLAPQFQVAAPGIAYCLTYAVYLPVSALVLRLSLGVSPRPRELALAAGASAVSLLLVTSGEGWKTRVAGLLLAVGWAVAAGVTRELPALAKRLRASRHEVDQ
jgi:PST family polysaccharide transporter